jgi:hypothetical protein
MCTASNTGKISICVINLHGSPLTVRVLLAAELELPTGDRVEEVHIDVRLPGGQSIAILCRPLDTGKVLKSNVLQQLM